jgi:serine protease Do
MSYSPLAWRRLATDDKKTKDEYRFQEDPMTHRFLLGMLLLLLVISAPAAQRATEGTGESWIFSSDEGGSGSSYMGVDIADVTGERLSELKLKEEHGAEITMVDSDAPAGKAGLKEHDVILSLNGTAVDSAAQLRRMIKETPSGRVVSLGISRDGQPMTIKVQLADRKKSVSWAPEAHEYKFEMPAMPAMPDIDIPISVVIAHSSLRSGLMVENITPQLGEFFGVKGGNGILVRSVEKGSRGEKAGFHAGDVIVKVSDQLVHDSSDFIHALRDAKNGSATVTVMRDKREQTLTITLPAKKDSGRLLENALDVSDLTAQLRTAENGAAHIAPEAIQKSLEDAARAQDAAQEAQDAAREAQDACREQMEGTQKDMEKQRQDEQEQFRERQKMMQDRQQKLQHEMSGEWTEI